MINTHVDALLEQLMAVLPNHLGAFKSDIRRTFRPLLETAFDDVGLVTREAFDAQVRVLQATRAQLDQLVLRLDAMVEGAAVSGGGLDSDAGLGASVSIHTDLDTGTDASAKTTVESETAA